MSIPESTNSDSSIDLSEIYNDKPFDTYEPIIYEKDDSDVLDIQKDETWNEVISSLQHSITNSYKLNHKPYNDYPYFKLSESFNYKPILKTYAQNVNSFVSDEKWKQIHGVLPYYQQYKDIVLLYKLSIDGSLFRTFYDKAKLHTFTVLIVKDCWGNVFGTFSSEVLDWNRNYSGMVFVGTGESFLFTFYKSKYIRVFYSTGENDNYIYCNENMIGFGCSKGNFGLCLKDNFTKGYSKRCDTYNNMELSEGEFDILDVELWGL